MSNGEDHPDGARPTRLGREAVAGARPWCARSSAANATLVREPRGAGCARAPPRAVVTLGPRQLRSRRDLRPLPDRDAAGGDDRFRRAVGELGLRRRAGPSAARFAWRSRNRAAAPTSLPRAEAAREAGGAGRGAGQRRRFAAGRTRRRDRAAAGRPRAQRRGDQVLHRRAERHRAAGGVLERRCGARCGALATAAGAARAGLGARLERGHRAAAGRPEPLRARPRPRLRRRRGGGAEAEGDLRPARGGLQRRRGAARPDGAGRAWLSGAGLRPGRRDARRAWRRRPRRRRPRARRC